MTANTAHAHARSIKPSPTVTLAEISGGERCRITSMDLQPADARMLHAMGLTDRCELCVCQPGEPCIVRINHTRLGIAGSLARKILVCQIDRQD